MKNSKEKKLVVKDHWRQELSKLRCWISGFNAGRHVPGTVGPHVPGEEVLRQIIMAIDDA